MRMQPLKNSDVELSDLIAVDNIFGNTSQQPQPGHTRHQPDGKVQAQIRTGRETGK
jgi:hypothetical protein